MLSQSQHVGLTILLEPCAGQAVPTLAVRGCEHGVGGLSHQRVPKHVLDGSGEAALESRRHHLALGEHGEPFTDFDCVRVFSQ